MLRKALPYIIGVLICFISGYIASRLQTNAIENWYPYLNKPSLTPPNWIFPIAWSTIYILSGISVGLIANKKNIKPHGILILWIVQQFFNFTWSIMFFVLENPLWGFINIIILDILVLSYIIRTWNINRVASILFWPYMIWIIFASYLNIYILLFN